MIYYLLKITQRCGVKPGAVSFLLNMGPLSVYLLSALACVIYASRALIRGLPPSHKQRAGTIRRLIIFELSFFLCYISVPIYAVMYEALPNATVTKVILVYADLTTSLFGSLTALVWLTSPGLALRYARYIITVFGVLNLILNVVVSALYYQNARLVIPPTIMLKILF